MATFVDELADSRGFSLIPLDRLGMVVLVNPRLLLPFKSILAYVRKQSQSAIFEYPPGWEKKVKVINISVPSKKAPAKPKSVGKNKPATPLPPKVFLWLAELVVAKGKLLLTSYLPLNGG